MAICKIQEQNHILKEDFFKMVECYLKLLKKDIEKPDNMKFFICKLSNKRILKFHFVRDAAKQKGYDLEFETVKKNHCFVLSNDYTDFDDAIKKIKQDLRDLFFEYPL